MKHESELREAMENRRALYALISQIYAAPLTQEQIESLASADLLSAGGQDGRIAHGLKVMDHALRKRHSGTRSALAADYTGVFYGLRTRNERAALPYESAFGPGEQQLMGRARGQVFNIYKKHALKLDEGLDIPEDHLSFECAFMAELAARTGKRISADDAEGTLRLLSTQSAFLAKHIARWFPAFSELASALAKERFYQGALEFTGGFFELDADLLQDAVEIVETDSGISAASVTVDLEELEAPRRDDAEEWKVSERGLSGMVVSC